MNMLAKNKSLWSKAVLERKMLQLRVFSYKLRDNYHNALVKTKALNKLSTESHKESLDFAAKSFMKPTETATSKRKYLGEPS